MSFFHHQAALFFEKLILFLEKKQLLDYEETPESLTLYLSPHKTYLFNLQAVLEQVWLSSPFSGGRHFTHKKEEWIDTRTGEEIFSVLLREIESYLSRTEPLYP